LPNLNIYLLAIYVARPKNPRQTSRAGYITNADNIQYDENLEIVRGWRDRYIKYSVVLDLTNEKVVKNSFQTGKTFEELFAHYHEGFSEYIEQTVNELNASLQLKG
jgi:hypothetical protein